MKTKGRILGIFLTLALVVVPFGCFGSARTVTHTDTVEPTQGTQTGTSTSEEVDITLGSGYAEPAVAQGKVFVWKNVDNKTHTVTNDKYAPYFEYFIGSGESVHLDLSGHPGVYIYYCRIHPNETAELIVP